MNALEVKDYLLNNLDKLEELLESLGLASIHKKGEELRCAREEGSNPTAIRIKLNSNLSYSDFKEDRLGDIFKLVGDRIGSESFPKNLKYICDFLNVGTDFQKIEKPKIFGGFFSDIKKDLNNENISYEMKTYPLETLNEYEILPCKMFQDDGISLETQIKYMIGYDWYTHRIIIPEFNCEGELVGITGRYNGNGYEEENVSKYLPIIEFEKSKVLFGYSQNYNHLLNNNIWLFESQKSVMKMDSQEVYNCLALGGKFISPIQLKYIQSLNPKSLILAYDEGIEEAEFIRTCERIKSKNIFNQYKVGYLYDENNEFLKKGSKDSPADLDVNILRKFSKKVKWIN